MVDPLSLSGVKIKNYIYQEIEDNQEDNSLQGQEISPLFE